ncbi:cupredoxin domain-containing protein [Microaerobacter geothermalis]|uniref:cupredoxin domain-containing protein n=1 Tax=Microaerobacter geothermalis TaxID=674972 RepID=UPI001F3C1A32|nr:cupredoxin domain-containing protein [Microaerobacter geothermalis]MCF6092777.1 cupredoxin domain-containing protein [Microaerobacter geothermalis]
MNKKGFLFTALLLVGILVLAGCSSSNKEEAAPADNANANTIQAENGVLNVEASNWKFNGEKFVVKSGADVTINLKNVEGFHGLAIDELGVNIQGDGSATFKADKPGEYTIYCSVPCGQGHNDMKSTLVVELFAMFGKPDETRV